MTAPYGPDRRQLMEVAVSSDLDVEFQAHKKAVKARRLVLGKTLVAVCQHLNQSTQQNCSRQHLLVLVLAWLSSETPQVLFHDDGASGGEGDNDNLEPIRHASYYDPTTEQALFQITFDALMEVLQLLEANSWACRNGKLLSLLVQFKAGQKSPGSIIFQEASSLA
jgi:hypothetical protein